MLIYAGKVVSLRRFERKNIVNSSHLDYNIKLMYAREEHTTDKGILLGMTPQELKGVVAELGMPAFSAKQLSDWLYRKGVGDISSMSNISIAARKRLAENYEVGLRAPLLRQESRDGTVKYLFPTLSGARVEAVFIPDGERGTLCVSSQVGCRMNCAFCATGRQGFQGHLPAADILNQIYALPEREQLTNIVFMGQGEPLDNLDAVMRATEILMAPYGLAWSPRRITVSTVGLRKGLRRFLDESPCHLAISMHTPFAEERAAIMPAERSYPLTEMLDLLREYDWHGQRRLSFEYIVFGCGYASPDETAFTTNATDRHLRELARLLRGLECRVNLIRWHRVPGLDFTEADPARMEAMRDYLTRHGVRCTIRASRGQDIDAACGLLNTKESDI